MTVFFYAKIIIEGGGFMLSDNTMQKFFSTPEIANLSVGEQGEMIKYFQAGLRSIKEDNENATISELFEPTKPVQQSVS